MRDNKSYYLFCLVVAIVLVLLSSCNKNFDRIYKDSLRFLSVEEGMDFYYYCNVDVKEPENTERFTSLFIFLHGATLDASNHYDLAKSAINRAGVSLNTVVVAPAYQMSNSRGNYYWTKYSWKDGRKSINAVPKISSYAVLDSLIIDNVLKNYPNIETVVLAGHSAGGQFVYRYAVLSRLPDLVSQRVVYLAMNPSSLTYLGPERWNKDKERWEVPLNGPSCSGYDEWIYGLNDLSSNEYHKEISASEILEKFPTRNMTIATGTDDVSGGGVDCEDLYQGVHRHERALLVDAHLNYFFPDNSHEILYVPGVNHNGDAMIHSPEVVGFLTKELR